MPAEKKLSGRIIRMPSDKTEMTTNLNVLRFEKSLSGFPESTDHFIRLIEYDEGVPFHIMFSNMAGDGHYVMLGNGIEKLTGLKRSDFTEPAFKDMTEEIVPLSDNTPSSREELRVKLINGELTDYRFEIRIRTADGNTKWVKETAIALKDPDTGDVTGAMGILHDISGKRPVMTSIENAAQKEHEDELLKTTFLQNISHEVRTPLNAIVGFSALLCEPDDSQYRKKEFLSMINNSTDHFLEIMDSIMEISKIEAGSSLLTLSKINLSALMAKVYRAFRQRANEREIELNFIYPQNDKTTFISDSYKLTRILNNLLGNALKFTLSGKIDFGYKDHGSFFEFYVTDTGIGISEASKKMIFRKFYQADSGNTRRFPGIGLGLPIAKAYVEMLGGEIDFISEDGLGSTFTITLPKSIRTSSVAPNI